MDIFNSAYYNFIRYMRDKKSLALMLLLPIVIIFILGNALESAFEPSNTTKTKVAYLNQDEGIGGQHFDSMLSSKDIQDFLTVEKVSSESEGMKLIKDKKASAFIKINRDFTSNINSRQNAEIEVYTGSNVYSNAVVKSIADGYASYANTQITLAGMGEQNPAPAADSSSNVVEQPISGTGKIPKAMDYYAVTMLVLILLYGSAYAIHGVGEDFLEEMGARLKSTPVKIYKQFIGKMLGIVVLLVLQCTVLILFTRYVYGANWGTDAIRILAIIATMAMFITTLGGMLCLLLKNRMAANGVMNVIIPVMTFMAGGYAYIPNRNGLFDTIRGLFPNSLAQNALFSVIYKSPYVEQDIFKGVFTQFQLSMLILWGMIAVMLLITSLAGRRRLA